MIIKKKEKKKSNPFFNIVDFPSPSKSNHPHGSLGLPIATKRLEVVRLFDNVKKKEATKEVPYIP